MVSFTITHLAQKSTLVLHNIILISLSFSYIFFRPIVFQDQMNEQFFFTSFSFVLLLGKFLIARFLWRNFIHFNATFEIALIGLSSGCFSCLPYLACSTIFVVLMLQWFVFKISVILSSICFHTKDLMDIDPLYFKVHFGTSVIRELNFQFWFGIQQIYNFWLAHLMQWLGLCSIFMLPIIYLPLGYCAAKRMDYFMVKSMLQFCCFCNGWQAKFPPVRENTLFRCYKKVAAVVVVHSIIDLRLIRASKPPGRNVFLT